MKEVDVKNQTQRIMLRKWSLLTLLQFEFIVITSPSITGVTYMDHFDFEERYRDVNECNPMHWYPLHLPDYCANIFEKLIRSKLASKTPMRIMRRKEKQKDVIYSLRPKHTRYGHLEHNYDFPFPIYQISSSEYAANNEPYGKAVAMTPYEEMLELLKEDIKKDPSSPTVTVMPNLGPVALYNQAVSKKSVNMIRQLAEAYVKATKKSYDEYYAAYGDLYPQSEPQLYVYDSAKNNTKEEKKKNKKDKKDKKDNGKNNKNKIYKVKSKHGNVITIVETNNVDMMKKDGMLIPVPVPLLTNEQG